MGFSLMGEMGEMGETRETPVNAVLEAIRVAH